MVSKPLFGAFLQQLPKVSTFAPSKQKYYYFDLTPTPPVFKHFDLMTGEVSNGFVGERFKNK